jgi:hypothetical protein
MLTENKRLTRFIRCFSANKYSVIGKFVTLMQGIGRLYEDGYGNLIKYNK